MPVGVYKGIRVDYRNYVEMIFTHSVMTVQTQNVSFDVCVWHGGGKCANIYVMF